jgi:dihydrofolate reductase
MVDVATVLGVLAALISAAAMRDHVRLVDRVPVRERHGDRHSLSSIRIRVKTQYYTASSLDGFIAGPNDSLDWLFTLGDIADTSYPTFIKDVGALAMGSATYEWMLRHVVGPEADHPEPWPYQQPVWVFTSRTLPTVPGADIRFARGGVRQVHEEMVKAAAGKNVWIVGGGDLVGQFHDAGLLDELFVQIGSVTLGAGKPLLPRAITNPPLRLLSVRAVGTGFAELHYAVQRRS